MDHDPGIRRIETRAVRLDPDQFARRYSESARVFWAIACGVLGRSSGAEDVLQEAAVVALSKLEQFEPETNFEAWMGSIVRFTALNALRAGQRGRARLRPLEEAAPLQAGDWGSMEPLDLGTAVRDFAQGAGAVEQQLGDELSQALRQLSAAARTCLLLRALCDLSFQEIAQLLAIPEGTAMSHVSRARAQLRASLLAAEAKAGVPRPKGLGLPRGAP